MGILSNIIFVRTNVFSIILVLCISVHNPEVSPYWTQCKGYTFMKVDKRVAGQN